MKICPYTDQPTESYSDLANSQLTTSSNQQNELSHSNGNCSNLSELEEDFPDLPNSFVQILYNDLRMCECCGRGSYGSVYRALWLKQNNKEVAVKKIHKIDKEAHVLSLLSHRNIVQFYGACVDSPNFFIVIEYAPHGSLFDFLSRGDRAQVQFSQLSLWSRDVALGMHYLHEEAPVRVIHRDLKSKNVVISKGFVLKICDFGASRMFDATVAMTIAGTYPWMAPELIQGLPTSELCDVYSFGVVLWELLTSEVPFKGLQGFQVAWAVVENEERPVIPSSCPTRFSSLIRRCWSTAVSERPKFSEIIAELNSMMGIDELKESTDSFIRSKPSWVVELQSKLDDIKRQQDEIGTKSEKLAQKEAKLKLWEDRLKKATKQQNFFGVARCHNTTESLRFNIAGCGQDAIKSVKEALDHVMAKSNFEQKIHPFDFPSEKSNDENISLTRSSSEPATRCSYSDVLPGSMDNGLKNATINDRPKFTPQNNNSSIKSNIFYDKSETKSDSKFVSTSSLFDSTDLLESTSKNCDSPQLKVQQKVASSAQEVNFEGSKGSCSRMASNGGEVKDPKIDRWESAKGDVKLSKTNENYEFEPDRIKAILNRPPPPPMRKFKSHRSTPNLFSATSLNKERLTETTPSNFPSESDIKQVVKLATANSDCSSPDELSNKLFHAFKNVYAAKQLSDSGKNKHTAKLPFSHKLACDVSNFNETKFNYNGSKKTAKPINSNLFELENRRKLFDSMSDRCERTDKQSRPRWKDFGFKTPSADNVDQVPSLPNFPIKAVKDATSGHQKKLKQNSSQNWSFETFSDLNPMSGSQLPRNRENLPIKMKPECINKAVQTISTSSKTSGVCHQFTQTDTNRPGTSPYSVGSKTEEHKNNISQRDYIESVKNGVAPQNEKCSEISTKQTGFGNNCLAMRGSGGGAESKKNKRWHGLDTIRSRSSSSPEIKVPKNLHNLNKDNEELSITSASNCSKTTQQCETAYKTTDKTPKRSVSPLLKIPADDYELNTSDSNALKPDPYRYGNGKRRDENKINISSSKTDCASLRLNGKHIGNETRLGRQDKLLVDEKATEVETLTCNQPSAFGSSTNELQTVDYYRNKREEGVRKYSSDHQRNQTSNTTCRNGKRFKEIPVVCSNVENTDYEKMEQSPKSNLHKFNTKEINMLNSSNNKKKTHFTLLPSTSKERPIMSSTLKKSDIIEAEDFLYIIVPRSKGT